MQQDMIQSGEQNRKKEQAEQYDNGYICLRAYAKINLGLDVIRKREDGYHDVKMIMQTIGLYDILEFQRLEEKRIEIITDNPEIPINSDNLIYRAAQLMQETYQLKGGIQIKLQKQIPVAAGMAGGSTNCAATLRAMNFLYQLAESNERLMELGVRLGADVPYCIMGGTACSEGIGEILSPLPAMPDCYILIAKPAIGVSTKYVYEHLCLNQLAHHPDIDGMCEALKQKDLHGMTQRMENVLEQVTLEKYPEITDIKSCMLQYGAENALMSGSGPTVFGIYTEEALATQAAQNVKRQGIANQVYVVHPIQKI